MSSTTIKAVTLSSLLGSLALATLASAADMPVKPAMEKCYGVVKAGKNDCASGAHSCAGQATKDFDKSAFIALPQGLCTKLAGGSLTASK